MSSVFSCGNCKKEYNEINKKPLSLPCGHVYCEECVKSFVISSESEKKEETTIKCPHDNKTHQIVIKTIPICYQIYINLPDCSNNKHQLFCQKNPTKRIKYLCANHQVLACSTCVVDHMGNGHELELIDISIDKINIEFKSLVEMYEIELSEIKDLNDKFEKIEKYTNDYFNHEYDKVDATFDKMVHLLHEKRKIIIEELNGSKIDCRAHLKKEKEKLSKKCEKLINNKHEIVSKVEEYVENKKYKEFYIKRQIYLNELKSISEIRINLTDFPFAYFYNSFKIEDCGGSLRYYKSFKEIEKRYNDRKNQRKNSSSIKTEEEHTYLKCKEHQSKNIFQDNLLNNKNCSNSPKKTNNSSSNILKVEKKESSSSANGINQSKNFNDNVKHTLINEFDSYKNEKESSELERKISIKKEDFKKITIDNQETKTEINKPENNIKNYNKKASFPFSHRELLPQNNNVNNNQHFNNEKIMQSYLKNENFFSNKMNRNNVILSNNTTQMNNPIKPGQKKSSNEKVVLSPTNHLNGNLANNNNNYITNTLSSEKGESKSPNKNKLRTEKNEKKHKKVVSSDKIVVSKKLTNHCENSFDIGGSHEFVREDKRSNSNKINSNINCFQNNLSEINNSHLQQKIGSSFDKNLINVEEKKKITKKTIPKAKIKTQLSDSSSKSF